MRGVVNDAVALYLREAAFAAAFAARWCHPAEDGCYRLRGRADQACRFGLAQDTVKLKTAQRMEWSMVRL
jgi:hypothetical protein